MCLQNGGSPLEVHPEAVIEEVTTSENDVSCFVSQNIICSGLFLFSSTFSLMQLFWNSFKTKQKLWLGSMRAVRRMLRCSMAIRCSSWPVWPFTFFYSLSSNQWDWLAIVISFIWLLICLLRSLLLPITYDFHYISHFYER